MIKSLSSHEPSYLMMLISFENMSDKDSVPEDIIDLTKWLANSMTSKHDLRYKLGLIKDGSLIPRLTDAQVITAVTELVNEDLVKNYPNIERRLIDPPIDNQEYCVHSFTPSSGAKPDDNGIYGIMKCRGAFSTTVAANLHSEMLVRDVDSFSKYFTGYVGRPFPVTVDGLAFSSEHEKIDLRDKVDLKDKIQKVARENILSEREKEKVTTKHLKSRAEDLQQSADDEASDPFNEYIQTRVKRSHLVYTIVETRKKIHDYLKSIKINETWLAKKDEENPEYRENFMEKFMEARRSSGVPDSDMSVMMYIDDLTPPNFWNGFIDEDKDKVEEEEEILPEISEEDSLRKILTAADADIVKKEQTSNEHNDLDATD
jgi:hypothetical protein